MRKNAEFIRVNFHLSKGGTLKYLPETVLEIIFTL
jgi:hypothetical protein